MANLHTALDLKATSFAHWTAGIYKLPTVCSALILVFSPLQLIA